MNQKGFSGLLVTVIIAVVAVVGAGGYFVLQRSSVKSELSQPQNLDDGQTYPQSSAELPTASDKSENTTSEAKQFPPEQKQASTPIATTPIPAPSIAQTNQCSRIFSPQYGKGPYYTGSLFDAHFHMPNLIDPSKIDPSKIEGHGIPITEHGSVEDTDAELDKLLCNFERERVRGAIGFTMGEEQLLSETLAGARSMKNRAGNKVNLFLTPVSFSPNSLDSVISNNVGLFGGFGEMAFYHPSYAQTPPDSSPMLEIYKVAEKHNFIVMMHPSGRQEGAVENALRQNPSVTFLIHGPEMENAIHGLIGKYPNAYYSIDAMLIRLPSAPGALMYMVGSKDEFKTKFSQNYNLMLNNTVNQWKSKIEQYPDRYMWGTDRSETWTYDEDISAMIEEFARDFIGELDPSVQEKFAYKNAEKLLGK